MRRFKTSVPIMIYCLLPAIVSFAQSSQLDLLQEYSQFLEQHKDMSASELLAMAKIGLECRRSASVKVGKRAELPFMKSNGKSGINLI